MPDALRVGIVGAGWMGHEHGRAWQSNAPRGRVVAVADVSVARAQGISDKFAAGAAVYPDLDALLGDPNIDAVDLCLPHHLHRDAIVAAAADRKHILSEKPLCLTLDEAREIRDAVQRAGVTLMVSHNQLFQPSLVEARRLLADGVLGRRYLARSHEMGRSAGFKTGQLPVPLAAGESPWSWRVDPARMGGGEVLDTGWHAAYRLLSLADSRPVEVQAMLANFYLPELDAGAEDTGVLLVRFESGMQGLLVTSWAFGDAPGGWQFAVTGERGTIAGTGPKVSYALHGWPPAERAFEPVHTYTRSVGHFLDVVLDGRPGLATWDRAARVLQLILGAYRAAAEGRAVSLPEDPTEL